MPVHSRASTSRAWARCRGKRPPSSADRDHAVPQLVLRSTCTNSRRGRAGPRSALMLLQAQKPVGDGRLSRGVLELYIQPPHFTKFKQPRAGEVFLAAHVVQFHRHDAALLRSPSVKSLRARALRHAENWLLEHQEANGSWGGIQPCYLLSTMALKGLGYRNDHPVIAKALKRRANHWEQDDRSLYHAVRFAQLGHRARGQGAARFRPERATIRRCETVRQMAHRPSDFQEGRLVGEAPDLEPGGWAFEFYNDWYPDVGRFGRDPQWCWRRQRMTTRRRASVRSDSAPTG